MSSMIDDIQRMLVRELEAFAREIELFPDDDAVWETLPGTTNSAGNLALHLSGNLKHYIGAVLGGDGYVRGISFPCGRFLIHLCAHAAFHLGQAGYLRRCLVEDNETSGGVSIKALA